MKDDPVSAMDGTDEPVLPDGTEQLDWDGGPGYPARSTPGGSTDQGTTSAEQRAGLSLDDRLSREEPDLPASSPGEDRPGRLVQPDEGVREDVDSDAVATDVGAGPDAEGWSPEERAMHLEPEADEQP